MLGGCHSIAEPDMEPNTNQKLVENPEVNMISAELISDHNFLATATSIFTALILTRGLAHDPEEQIYQAIALADQLTEKVEIFQTEKLKSSVRMAEGDR